MSREQDLRRIEEEQLLLAQSEMRVTEQRKRLARLCKIAADTTGAAMLLDSGTASS
jgi:hypothetical protein